MSLTQAHVHERGHTLVHRGSRPEGTTVLEALRDHVIRLKDLLASSDAESTATMATVVKIIAEPGTSST